MDAAEIQTELVELLELHGKAVVEEEGRGIVEGRFVIERGVRDDLRILHAEGAYPDKLDMDAQILHIEQIGEVHGIRDERFLLVVLSGAVEAAVAQHDVLVRTVFERDVHDGLAFKQRKKVFLEGLAAIGLVGIRDFGFDRSGGRWLFSGLVSRFFNFLLGHWNNSV